MYRFSFDQFQMSTKVMSSCEQHIFLFWIFCLVKLFEFNSSDCIESESCIHMLDNAIFFFISHIFNSFYLVPISD